VKAIVFILSIVFFVPILNGQKSFYDFVVKDIDGNDYPLKELKGKKVLVVNTASECGFTPQYEDLEKLYNEYKDNDFIILGFPANNFGHQEPGSNQEIKAFCQKNYGVSFPMMSKISVKGDDIHPLYKWLTSKDLNGEFDSGVKWNFQKYMIDEEGHLVDYGLSTLKPFSRKITEWIEEKD